MERPKVLLVDVFDTLIPLSEPTVQYVRATYGLDWKVEDLTANKKASLRFRQLTEECLEEFIIKREYPSLFPDAAPGLQQFADEGYRIHVVTSGTEAYSPFISFLLDEISNIAEFHFQSSKIALEMTENEMRSETLRLAQERCELAKRIGATAGIDDSFTNVLTMAVGADMRMCLRIHPWNNDSLIFGDITSCHSIPEAFTIITTNKSSIVDLNKIPTSHLAKPSEQNSTTT